VWTLRQANLLEIDAADPSRLFVLRSPPCLRHLCFDLHLRPQNWIAGNRFLMLCQIPGRELIGAWPAVFCTAPPI
jgi:hypothetical protein